MATINVDHNYTMAELPPLASVTKTIGYVCAAFLPLAPGDQINHRLQSRARYAEVATSTQAAPKASSLLRQLRQGFGFNVTELAQIMGVSRPTIYSWLKDERPLKQDAINKLNKLNAVAAHWKEVCNDEDLSFLLDYTGPNASEPSIRESLQTSDGDAETLKALIDQRYAQYLTASEQSSEILGATPKLADSPIPKSTHKLNNQWATNAQALKAAQNKKS